MFDRHWIWYYYKVSQFIHPIWTRINLINNLVFLLFNFIYSTLSWIHCVAKILDFYFISNAFFLSICQKIEVHFLLFCFQQLLKKTTFKKTTLQLETTKHAKPKQNLQSRWPLAKRSLLPPDSVRNIGINPTLKPLKLMLKGRKRENVRAQIVQGDLRAFKDSWQLGTTWNLRAGVNLNRPLENYRFMELGCQRWAHPYYKLDWWKWNVTWKKDSPLDRNTRRTRKRESEEKRRSGEQLILHPRAFFFFLFFLNFLEIATIL